LAKLLANELGVRSRRRKNMLVEDVDEDEEEQEVLNELEVSSVGESEISEVKRLVRKLPLREEWIHDGQLWHGQQMAEHHFKVLLDPELLPIVLKNLGPLSMRRCLRVCKMWRFAALQDYAPILVGAATGQPTDERDICGGCSGWINFGMGMFRDDDGTSRCLYCNMLHEETAIVEKMNEISSLLLACNNICARADAFQCLEHAARILAPRINGA
jgi:hypothetical protein